jgi:hypothetical protein
MWAFASRPENPQAEPGNTGWQRFPGTRIRRYAAPTWDFGRAPTLRSRRGPFFRNSFTFPQQSAPRIGIPWLKELTLQ